MDFAKLISMNILKYIEINRNTLKYIVKNKSMNKLLVILGPTASGKSDLAIKIAKSFNGEIISADSRQIYKEMNIGTAKPIKNNLHHLLNIVNPNQRSSAAEYKKLAYKTIKNIQNRNKLPILCGGTGLYISSVIENWQFPKIPPQEKLRKELEKKSIEQLFKTYQKMDPDGAKFIDKKNKRRLIRAIEVCKTNNKAFWQQRKKNKPTFKALLIGIKLPKEELKERIVILFPVYRINWCSIMLNEFIPEGHARRSYAENDVETRCKEEQLEKAKTYLSETLNYC